MDYRELMPPGAVSVCVATHAPCFVCGRCLVLGAQGIVVRDASADEVSQTVDAIVDIMRHSRASRVIRYSSTSCRRACLRCAHIRMRLASSIIRDGHYANVRVPSFVVETFAESREAARWSVDDVRVLIDDGVHDWATHSG